MNINYLSHKKTGTFATESVINRFARSIVFRQLERITQGELVLMEGDNVYTFGTKSGPCQLQATIFINHNSAYRDILLNGSIGAGEAYILEKWQSSNLVDVIRILSINLNIMNELDDRWSVIKNVFVYLVHKLNTNTPSGSRKNIAAHYDLGNRFFSIFLDQTMMYSSAVYPDVESDLETAAINKLDMICKKLELVSSDHLLEIGTGWGGMAIYAARQYGCKVTTTTISQEQYNYAVENVRDAGLEDRITVLLKDYRELQGSFDKIVSIEMIEAVGHRYYAEYFRRCSELLKENGLMLIQAITIADQRYKRAIKSVDFIQRYIFPGGELPSIEVISKHVSADTDMQIIHLEDITLHYARTLADWKKRFFQNKNRILNEGFDNFFIRMWEFYFSYCEGGFRERVIGTSQLVFAKPGFRFPGAGT